jgi:hypothetical protein
MMARMGIAGGLGVWLSSVAYAVLLLTGPLPFMGVSVLLIFVYWCLLALSCAMFSIGICRHAGFSAIRTLPLLVLYLVFALATGTICRFLDPFLCQLVVRTSTHFGRSALPFAHAYYQIRLVPLWNLIWFSAGLPLGTWALYAWVRRTRLWSTAMPDNSELKPSNTIRPG